MQLVSQLPLFFYVRSNIKLWLKKLFENLVHLSKIPVICPLSKQSNFFLFSLNLNFRWFHVAYRFGGAKVFKSFHPSPSMGCTSFGFSCSCLALANVAIGESKIDYVRFKVVMFFISLVGFFRLSTQRILVFRMWNSSPTTNLCCNTVAVLFPMGLL